MPLSPPCLSYRGCAQVLMNYSNREAVGRSGIQGSDPVVYKKKEVKSVSALYVGIDVSQKELVGQGLNEQGEQIFKPFHTPNNLPGCEKLRDTILLYGSGNSLDDVQIGLEATNVYWEHAFRFLANDDKLNTNFNLQLFTLNPKVVKNFKDIYGNTLPKNDNIDSWVIADRLRFGHVQSNSVPETVYQALRQLTRFRFQLASSLRAEKNRALNLIFFKFSNYNDEAPFDTFSKASMAFLEHFSLEEIATTDLEDLATFLIENSNNRLGGNTGPEEIAKLLRRTARNAYRLSPKMEDAVTQTLTMTFDTIRFMQGQLKRADKNIARQLEAIPQTLITVPGMGPTLTAGIISEIGDVNRFKSQASLANYAGLVWHTRQSGSFNAEETSLTKEGNKYLRYYLVEAANSLRVHNEQYRRYYYKKYQEVPKHKHKRALVLAARKFVRLVFALLTKGEIYQPRRYN